MRQLVVGLGETGRPLFNVLQKADQFGVIGYDPKEDWVNGDPVDEVDYLHICIPYSDKFISIVKDYQEQHKPKITVIHSTVPVGTTSLIPKAVHSPILGRHDDMEGSLKKFVKWVGGKFAGEIAEVFARAGMITRITDVPEETELMKLICLAKYGMSIAFANWQKEILDIYNIP